MNKTVILCCPTLEKELSHAIKDAGSDATVIILPDELHSDPCRLRKFLQGKIDSIVDADRIVICPSGCGGGTIGLKATNCELIIPKTRDCIDILLSGTSIKDIDRPKHGIFMTESWTEYSKRSTIDPDKVIADRGDEEGKAFLRRLYKGFEHFYVIDTGAYDVKPVMDYLEKLRDIVNGTVDVVPGKFGVLRKIARGNFDSDFLVVQKGDSIPLNYYTVDRDL